MRFILPSLLPCRFVLIRVPISYAPFTRSLPRSTSTSSWSWQWTLGGGSTFTTPRKPGRSTGKFLTAHCSYPIILSGTLFASRGGWPTSGLTYLCQKAVRNTMANRERLLSGITDVCICFHSSLVSENALWPRGRPLLKALTVRTPLRTLRRQMKRVLTHGLSEAP